MNSELRTDEQYMQQALKLARRGIGLVEPNPTVGCIIVKEGKIIARGWHKKFGGPHAEINALTDCARAGGNPQRAVMYVTLEPCCHYGKTGPCTDEIIKAGISRVVVAMVDPSRHANGRGLDLLRSAGVEVETGVCEDHARLLNAPFLKFATTGKPWVILKWAQSVDGMMSYSGGSQDKRWISNEVSRRDAHKLRRRAGAIVVGIGTILEDDSLLVPCPPRGKRPVRVVLDTNLRIPLACRLLQTVRRSPVLVVAGRATVDTKGDLVDEISATGADVLPVSVVNGYCNIGVVLDELAARGISQVLVEGGARVISSFFKGGFADEVVVYVSPKFLGTSGKVSICEALGAVDCRSEQENMSTSH